MNSSVCKTPVLFMVFNRPETTMRVFEEIRKVRPAQLFINADGPRAHVPEDKERCEKTRDEILSRIDWECEVKTRFLDTNLGIKYAPSSAIDWFFEHVEEGIILEADCLPEQTFFPFCTELLEKYRSDDRVMQIGGTNVEQQNKKFKAEASYYFLSAPCIWGWATWRRAWKHYDVELNSWPTTRDNKLLYKILPSSIAFRLSKKFQGYYDKKITSWDGQWLYTCLVQKGLCIFPSKNLISNIGFDEFAAQTTHYDPLWTDQPTEPMEFPLMHPPTIHIDRGADEYNYAASFWVNRHWSDKVKWFFKLNFTKPYIFSKRIYYKTFAPHKYDAFAGDDESTLLP